MRMAVNRDILVILELIILRSENNKIKAPSGYPEGCFLRSRAGPGCLHDHVQYTYEITISLDGFCFASSLLGIVIVRIPSLCFAPILSVFTVSGNVNERLKE